MAELTIQASRYGDMVLLRLAGSLDTTTLPELEEYLQRLLFEWKDSAIINLYECEYLDEPATNRLEEVVQELRSQRRAVELFVRPLSFVAYRTRNLPQAARVPEQFAKEAEERLAEKRMQRLNRWRQERPLSSMFIPASVKASMSTPPEAGTPPQGPGEALVSINFQRVSVLAGKDEQVVQRIWETYTRLLDENAFPVAPDGNADTQLAMDSRKVAFELRLDPKEVRKVIESVSTYLIEVFGNE